MVEWMDDSRDKSDHSHDKYVNKIIINVMKTFVTKG